MTENVINPIPLLHRVEKINKLFNRISRLGGSHFNIFSILKMERDEVRTHSAFLYELLNPKGSHAQDDKFLSLFLTRVLKRKNLNINNIKIEKEKFANVHGRIDITIETTDLYIIIENKIDMIGSKGQLKRYKDFADKQRKQSAIFYLTLYGDSPVEDGSVVEVELLSYKYDVVEWLDVCIKEVALIPGIREILLQYRNLIKKITNQNEEEELTMETIDILREGNNLQIADIIANAIEDTKARIEKEFWESLKISCVPIMEKLGFSHEPVVNPDICNDDFLQILKERQRTINSREKSVGLDFTIGKYNDFQLMFGIYEDSNVEGIYLSFYLAKDNKWEESQKNIDKRFLEAFEALALKQDDSWHLGYKETPQKNAPINFYDDNIYKISDKQALKIIVNEITQEVEAVMQSFNKTVIKTFLM